MKHVVVAQSMEQARWYISSKGLKDVHIVTKREYATGLPMKGVSIHLLAWDTWIMSCLHVSVLKSYADVPGRTPSVYNHVVYALPDIAARIAVHNGLRLWLRTMVEREEKGMCR